MDMLSWDDIEPLADFITFDRLYRAAGLNAGTMQSKRAHGKPLTPEQAQAIERALMRISVAINNVFYRSIEKT